MNMLFGLEADGKLILIYPAGQREKHSSLRRKRGVIEREVSIGEAMRYPELMSQETIKPAKSEPAECSGLFT